MYQLSTHSSMCSKMAADQNKPIMTNPSFPRVSVDDLMDILTVYGNGSLMTPTREYDEVFPRIFLSTSTAAFNKHLLKSLGVTHVLNCAHGNKAFGNVRVEPGFYDDVEITFHHVLADDRPNFNIRSVFLETNNFISQAIGNAKEVKGSGRIFVHCREGFSRSAAVVVAYLMSEQKMTVQRALEVVRCKREIGPNKGFLQQLIDYGYAIGSC